MKIPVTIGFDHTQVIGFLEIDEARLPPRPDFHFALGYQALDGGGYKLLTVSLIADAQRAA